MESMFERDLLYPTDNPAEPGSVHVHIYNPDKNGKVPVAIEAKTAHSPIKYLDEILRIMQGDIFDRILLQVRTHTVLYIKSNDEIQREFGDKAYIKIVFNSNKEKSFEAVDEISIIE